MPTLGKCRPEVAVVGKTSPPQPLAGFLDGDIIHQGGVGPFVCCALARDFKANAFIGIFGVLLDMAARYTASIDHGHEYST